MDQLWDELLQVLTEILDVYRVLLVTSKEKREVLVHGKAPELEQLNQREDLLIIQAGKLDVRRENIVNDLAVHQGQAKGSFTLTQMQTVATPAVREKLQHIGDELDGVLAELLPLNKLNTELIKQSLVFVNYSINLLTQSESDNTYAPKGNPGQVPTASRRIFDQRV